MSPDTSKEQLHLSDILSELIKIDNILKKDVEFAEPHRGILALKTQCDVYINTRNGLFPFIYDTPATMECCQYVASAFDVARYFRAVSDKRKLRKIKPHLNLIGIAGFGVSATIAHQQNSNIKIETLLDEHQILGEPLEVKQDATRKSLELMLGLAALGRFGDVNMEDPDNSSDTTPNPDVVIPYKGENYGIACKSIATRHHEGVRENIKKAVTQIERAVKAGVVTAGRGLVFLDVSPLINHREAYLPPERNTIWTREGAAAYIKYITNAAFNAAAGVTKETPAQELFKDIFEGSPAAPTVLIYAHALMITDILEGGAPSYLKCLMYSPIGDASRTNAFVTELNLGIHGQIGPGK